MDHLSIKGDAYLLFDNHPLPMYISDVATNRFLAVNAAAIEHYGYSREEFMAMSIFDIRPKEDVPLLKECMAIHADAGLMMAGTWRHAKKDGTIISVEVTRSPIEFKENKAFLVLIHDVTERIRYEEALRQSTKMEAVGRLAGGVAHDFNNVLTIILGYCNLTLDQMGVQDPLRQNLEGIRKAADRAALLTRQMLAFSRRQVLQPRILNLNGVVADASKLLRRMVGEDVEVITTLDDKLSTVKADPSQIEQILMNLVVNARDAMPNGGKIVIETRNVNLDVMLAVSDDGMGMDAETQSHIFEPFFTTKPADKGTGLGLAMVYGIIKQSGGNIGVYSEPGHGTTFKIYLPVETASEEPREKAAVAAVPRTGSETILLVEDEDELRHLTRVVLTRNGYRVLEAANGEDALRVAALHLGPIPLLLSDVIMPRLGGRELARRLAPSRPETRVIFMSGYASDAVVQYGQLEAGIVYIEKPFAVDSLMQKVRDVLDGKFD